MDASYWATAEVLIAIAQIGAARELPPPERLREEILALLQRMTAQCRKAGFSDSEIAEIHYALVAFIDDCILKSAWTGRTQWMSQPLQLQHYGEYTAGENFFRRMGMLLQRGDSARALETYYLCLALGFTGALPAEGAHTPQSYLQAARPRLPTAEEGAAISPHAIPRDHPSFISPRRPLVLGLILGCAFVAVLGLSLLRWSLSNTIDRTGQTLRAAAISQSKATGSDR
jgi:type VI secretion system protein ImpK